MGKQNLYEHSVHVPLIIGGPNIPRGQKRDGFCYLLDVFPTLCDLISVPIPGSVEGKSLVGLVRGRKGKVRETLFFAYKDAQRGVRDERYKLIEYKVKDKRTTQLFDLQVDPWELNNLADKPAYGTHLKRLRKELLRWKEETGDSSQFWQNYGAKTL
jgi:arylsulfatase A-like enzyme